MSAGEARSPDEQARAQIQEALDATLVVEAAAGTGKTTALVNRIIQVIASGRAKVRDIVAVTFTEKAAGELKLRLRRRLEDARREAASPAVASRLEAAVQELEEAHVSTIHGFCADLLRERPVEAGVDPLFRVLTEGQAERLFDDAFAGWLQEQLEAPPPGVRRSLRRSSRNARPGEVNEDGPVERLRRAGLDLTEWRDFRGEWTREPFDRQATAAAVVELVHALADLSSAPSYAADNLFLDTEPVRRLSQELRGRGGDAVLDLDGLEARLVDLHRDRSFRRGRKGSGPTYGRGVSRAQVLAARDALVQALGDFQVRADADLAALLHGELLSCVDRYEALKAREGALDFLDLLLRARDLIRRDADVRRHFQARFTRIFVDEFQDTDPLQAEVLLLLASRTPDETRWEHVDPVPGKLFIVGDPNQSIYRFRRADVEIYRRVCELLVTKGATRVELRRSFRAVPNLQRTINAAFAPIMQGDAAEAVSAYMPLEPSRGDVDAQPSVIALPVPEPYGLRFVAAREIERSLPDAVGAFVEWLVRKSGWTVTERRDPSRRVALQARHVCVLFRRFMSYGEDVTRAYVEALEARGLHHLLVGGKAFHDRPEIETLRAALAAIEWPDDQLSVFATLRGAFFAIGDEDLLEYRHISGRFHPFRVPDGLPSALEPITQALGVLASLHRRRNQVPVAATISALIEATRAHVGFVLRPGGEQVLANVLHVAELARQYELEGGMSFRGFVETLRRAASGAHAPEAPILEEGSDGVRLMTVHKAKGLEFPVVILADMTARLTPWDASRSIDADARRCAIRIGGWSPKDLNDRRELELLRERREGERVTYVAATRARDLLVVPVVGDEPYTEGWVSPLNSALYPPAHTRRHQVQPPGCPPFASKDSVLRRPDGDPASSATVCPGEHVWDAADEAHRAVWWAPDVLPLAADMHFGLRRNDLIVKDVSPEVLRRYLDAFEVWRRNRAAAAEAASQPSVRVVTATEAAVSRPERFEDVEVVVAGATGGIDLLPFDGHERRDIGGTRFGTLVHAILADTPLEVSDVTEDIGSGADDPVAQLALAHGRLLGAEPDEVAAARLAVRSVLSHPMMRAAARAAVEGRCYREAPVTLRLEDGTVVEGTVDLAYVEDGGMVVVDFKTDRELEGSLEQYRRQVQIYASGIGAALGIPARGVLMRV